MALIAAIPAGITAVAYLAALLASTHRNQAGGLLALLYGSAVAAAVGTAYLLADHARHDDDLSLRWVSAGFGMASSALTLQLLAFEPLSVRGGPFGMTSAGLSLTYLLWHSMLAGAALAGAFAVRWRWRVVAGAAAALGIAGAFAVGSTPLLAGADGQYGDPMRLLIGGLAVFTGATALLWRRAHGPRLIWPHSWVFAALVFATWELVIHAFSTAIYSTAWWTTIALRWATFVVPAVGLVVGYCRLRVAMTRYEHSLSLIGAGVGMPRTTEIDLRPADVAPRGPEPDADRLRVAYQVIFDADTLGVMGVEALARFSDGRPPAAAFAAAERAGHRVDLELAAVRAALSHARDRPPGVLLHVNVSPMTVADERFLRLVADQRDLVVELTEHDAVVSYGALNEALDPLRRCGVRVAVDDAGAGYASLNHVLRLRPDLIKLDLSLIQGIDRDPARQSLAAALAEFAADIGAGIVAEGVETAAELDQVRMRVGGAWVQGFFLSRPAPFGDIFPAPATRA